MKDHLSLLLSLALVACPGGGAKEDSGPVDADGDGFFSVESGGDDCDDENPHAWPGAPEYCNGRDDDCDGEIDEIGEIGEGGVVDPLTFYLDADGDHHGDAASPIEACAPEAGQAIAADDCDDANPEVHPEANELCNGVDDDCDGNTDLGAVDATAWYLDADGDGWGDPAFSERACVAPEGHVATDGDCDDTRADVHPEAVEPWGATEDLDCDGDLFSDGSLADAPATILATGEISSFGRSLSVGDPDGDGQRDLLVGSEGGGAFLFRGPLVADLSTDDAFGRLLPGDDPDLGAVVVFAGDLDGDGFDELALGESGFRDLGDPAVHLLAGGPLDETWPGAFARLRGPGPRSDFGWALAAGGDTDGDGLDELLVGAPAASFEEPSQGAVWLISGPLLPDLGLEDFPRIRGEATSGQAGYAVCAAGDQDGDGLGDLLVGAPTAILDTTYYSGVAYLVRGPVAGDLSLADADARVHRSVEGDAVGETVAGGGDMDGDGIPDLLIGAPYGGGGPGRVWLLLGPLSGEREVSSADALLEGVGPVSGAGAALAFVPDLDDDGRDEILVGAPVGPEMDPGRGDAFVVLGPVKGTLSLAEADARLLGATSGALAGFALGVADLDGDARPDLLVGAPGDLRGSFGALSLLLTSP